MPFDKKKILMSDVPDQDERMYHKEDGERIVRDSCKMLSFVFCLYRQSLLIDFFAIYVLNRDIPSCIQFAFLLEYVSLF